MEGEGEGGLEGGRGRYGKEGWKDKLRGGGGSSDRNGCTSFREVSLKGLRIEKILAPARRN